MSVSKAGRLLDVAQVDATPGLIGEAARQLTICNACRYCEGLCAVFPALERRAEFGHGDVSQLANLCHDCRACYDACMYSPPHDFDLDLPRVLAQVRLDDYGRYVWPRRVPKVLSGWRGLVMGSVLSVVIMLAIAVAHASFSELVAHPGGPSSPYRLIPYPALLSLMLAAIAYAVVVMAAAGLSYWRDVGGAPAGLTARAVLQAVWYAMTLRYLRGGGEECYLPGEEVPTPVRRHLHGTIAYGFGLCLLSTIAAAVMQDILGSQPPYPWLSVPVISGTAGGVAMVIGCAGMLILKERSPAEQSVSEMSVKDYGLLVALAFLALTGLAVLLTRATGAFGLVLLIHLAALLQAFAMAPYSKFVHVVFRFLALVRDNLERDAA